MKLFRSLEFMITFTFDNPVSRNFERVGYILGKDTFYVETWMSPKYCDDTHKEKPLSEIIPYFKQKIARLMKEDHYKATAVIELYK